MFQRARNPEILYWTLLKGTSILKSERHANRLKRTPAGSKAMAVF